MKVKLDRWELEDTGTEFCELEWVNEGDGEWVKFSDLAPILAIVEAAVAWVDCMKPGADMPVGSLRKAVVALDEAVRAAREKGVIQ